MGGRDQESRTLASAYSPLYFYLVSFLHLVVCVCILFATPGDQRMTFGGKSIPPAAQWLNSSFCCVTIVSIIVAAIGNLYQIESHLDVYFYMLVIALVVDCVWLKVLLGTYWCILLAATTEASQHCGQTSWGSVLLVLCYVIFKGAAIWIVTQAAKSARIQYHADLLPYLKRSLASSLAVSSLDARCEDVLQARSIDYGSADVDAPRSALDFRSVQKSEALGRGRPRSSM